MSEGRLVSVTDTKLFIEERGRQGAFPILEPVVFERSGDMFYVEEQDRLLGTVLDFLNRAFDED
jgi:hypothetical protein